MTIGNYRAHEALYTVIFRDDNSEKLLKQWCQENRVATTIDNNRMHVYDQRTLMLFNMTWSHGWERITIWDCWNKRHVTW